MDKRYSIFRPALSLCLAWLPFFLTSSALSAKESAPAMRMETSSTKVYEGSAFKLLIHLDNTDTDTPPDMSYLDSEFQVEYLGPSRRNATRITFINGRQIKEEDKGITFAYALTPKSSGKIEVASPEITIDGQTLSAPPVLIEVIEPNRQDLVELRLSADTDSVYPLVPFEVTLTILARELPDSYASRDPIRLIASEVSPPVLGISWADDSALPPSLKPEEPWDEWITRYQEQDRGGFSINGIRAGGMFDLSWAFGGQSQNLAMFLPKPERIELPNRSGGTDRFWQYQFKRRFIAEKTGPVSFDAVSLKGYLAKEGDDGKLAAEQVYALSKPLEVVIRDVPEENRPDDYIGAFGSFSLDTSVTPQSGQVGEALTFTLTLHGTGSVLNVKAPNLEADPRIAEHFRIYPPTEKLDDGQVQWTWSLRPTEPIDGEFPPIQLSYFNVENEEFVRLQSDPVALKIKKAEGNAASARLSRSGSAARLVQAEGGIFGNASSPSGLFGKAFPARLWWQAIGIIWFVPLVGWVIRWGVRRRAGSDSVQLARRIADSRLSLAEGIELFGSSDRSKRTGGSRKLLDAFLLPAADHFPMALSAVSAAEFTRFLDTLKTGDTAGAELYTEVAAALESLSQVQYGSLDGVASIDWQALHQRWTDRLSQLKPAQFPKMSKTAVLFFLTLSGAFLIGTLSGCAGSDQRDGGGTDIATDFAAAEEQFHGAEALLGNGENSQEDENGKSSQAEFLKAVELYEKIIDRYGENGAVLFNLGNAYSRASRNAEALAAWRRAQAYIPGDPYLQANIDSILPGRPSDKRPLFETLLPWQNHLGIAAKGYAALLFSILAASILVFFLLTGGEEKHTETSAEKIAPIRSVLRRSFWVLLALTLIAGASYLYDLHRYAPGTHGIAAVDTLPRKGSSDRYDPLYRDPLPALSEMKILDRQSDWLLAQFPDHQTGWLPEKDVLVW